jgi:SAM-dependent methyltransferase
MKKKAPLLNICRYKVKPGKEAEMERLLAVHWPALHAAGLVTDEKARVYRGLPSSKPDGRHGADRVYVEIMVWKDHDAPGLAHQLPSVMAVRLRESPSHALVAAVEASDGNICALDVGCGAGVFSIWLAEKGAEVTGIDVFPEAIAMARSLADKRGANVELLTANLFTFTPERAFDLVYDSGCLHSLVGGNTDRYKQKLLGWLSSGGAFVLEHWGNATPSTGVPSVPADVRKPKSRESLRRSWSFSRRM